MLSPVLSSAPHPPPIKSLNPISFRQLPTFKNPILMRRLGSKSRLGGRSRVSKSKGIMELARADAFESTSIEEDGAGEAEAILENRPSVFARDFSSGDLESTMNRMSKWFVAGLFGLIILWKHDAGAMWAAMGSVVNAWLSITLKQILNHERPDSALRSDPGMPSSHAQSIFYAALFAILSLVHWLGINLFTVTVGIFTFTSGCYLSWLRVSQQLHTVSQVLVGALLGSTCGIIWFWMWHSFVLNAFVSFLWVRILVVVGSVTFCVAFLLHVVQHWLRDG
ncbi:lipid phosphate phosphatase epsilon 1, chloroplastic [Elaeis guineensis]|uniref:Lipid phosphate phosphatase epsilon 1, chloroplastic n=1 Tax=Elaeis guineensis var. tenera TaxID=51953 RepID=A0A6I9QCA5_ELAGV|nr:lipid phosphate phosphatase epsilon 1, chloroplastic [Elaeis guineensis]